MIFSKGSSTELIAFAAMSNATGREICSITKNRLTARLMIRESSAS